MGTQSAVLVTCLCLLPPCGAQDPVPASVGLTARCYYPATIVLTWPAHDGAAAEIHRGLIEGPDEKLVDVPAGTHHYYDTGLEPGAKFLYHVRLIDGTELGPVPAANSPEMLVGGDLEDTPPGEATETLAFHRAYGPPWWSIVEEPRPGSPGERLLRVRAGSPPRRDGLHSRLLPVDPRATYRQSGWHRVLPGGSARLGRQLLASDLTAAGDRIVPYSYASVMREADDGWAYCEQRLTGLPEDTAYIQVWALAFETRRDVWLDDLSLIDERTERLFEFAAGTALKELLELSARTEDQALRLEAPNLADSVRRLQAALDQPADMPVSAYLDQVHELGTLVQRAEDLVWDLKILTLAE